MQTIKVYRCGSDYSGANRIELRGENLKVNVTDQGVLNINNWATETERGSTAFAPGQWSYFSLGQPRTDLLGGG